MSALLSVTDALAQILTDVTRLDRETVPLGNAAGRVLAEDIKATRTQPPFPASAMDGYAARTEDLKDLPGTLTRIGESAAGHRFKGTIVPGQCVRIFTGAPVPPGADTIVIQENVTVEGDQIYGFEGRSKRSIYSPGWSRFRRR